LVGEFNPQGTDWLLKSVPGTPGTDYPILAEVPETKFACDGQVEGGEIKNQITSYSFFIESSLTFFGITLTAFLFFLLKTFEKHVF